MLRAKSLRWIVPLIIVAALAVAASVTGSIPIFSYRPHMNPPTAYQGPPPLSPSHPAYADQAKPVYKGPLGEFLVTPGDVAAFPPCPKPLRLTRDYKSSELYSPALGDNLSEVYACADGKINLIEPNIGGPVRRYFVGPAKVPFEAPFERLVLLTVGGHSAIAQLPIPGFPGTLRIEVIERFPTSHEPGILVGIDNVNISLKEAAAAAAQIMGVKP